MDKIDIRAVINYFDLKNLTHKEIKYQLDSTLKDSFPSLSTLTKWAA